MRITRKLGLRVTRSEDIFITSNVLQQISGGTNGGISLNLVNVSDFKQVRTVFFSGKKPDPEIPGKFLSKIPEF